MASHMIITTRSGNKHKVDFDADDPETARKNPIEAAESFFNAVTFSDTRALHLNNLIVRMDAIETMEFF